MATRQPSPGAGDDAARTPPGARWGEGWRARARRRSAGEGRPDGPSAGFGAWCGVARGGVVRRGLAVRAREPLPLGFLGFGKRWVDGSGRTVTMGDLRAHHDGQGGWRIVTVGPVWRDTARRRRPPSQSRTVFFRLSAFERLVASPHPILSPHLVRAPAQTFTCTHRPLR